MRGCHFQKFGKIFFLVLEALSLGILIVTADGFAGLVQFDLSESVDNMAIVLIDCGLTFAGFGSFIIGLDVIWRGIFGVVLLKSRLAATYLGRIGCRLAILQSI